MTQNQDTAKEPVNKTDDADFMDTGMLHEPAKPEAEKPDDSSGS